MYNVCLFERFLTGLSPRIKVTPSESRTQDMATWRHGDMAGASAARDSECHWAPGSHNGLWVCRSSRTTSTKQRFASWKQHETCSYLTSSCLFKHVCDCVDMHPSFHSIPFHSIHSIPFHSIPFHSIPFHSIPFHSISIPFHSIPFHSIPFHSCMHVFGVAKSLSCWPQDSFFFALHVFDRIQVTMRAGLDYFRVRTNISRHCGALSRVFVFFFGWELLHISTSSPLCLRRAMNVALPDATLKMKLLTSLSDEERQSLSTMLAASRAGATISRSNSFFSSCPMDRLSKS